MQGKNLPWAVGLVAFLVTSLAFLVVSHNPVAAAVIGALAAAILALGVRFSFPIDSDLDAYNVKARRGVNSVLASVKEILRMAKQVDDAGARSALEDGCRKITDLLASVQERDPNSVASMAAKLNVTTGGIQNSLTQYLKIQKDPDLYDGASDLMLTGQAGFKNFQGFVVKTYRDLNAAEVRNYKATLAALEPLQIPQLTT